MMLHLALITYNLIQIRLAARRPCRMDGPQYYEREGNLCRHDHDERRTLPKQTKVGQEPPEKPDSENRYERRETD